MEKVRYGIVGTGIIAQAHYEGIKKNPKAKLTCICDISEEQMDLFQEAMETGQIARYTNYKEMIQSGDADGILVCTPTSSHGEISIFAAEHGVHIFCEKPAAMNFEEAKRMEEAAAKNHIISMVGFAFRYIPAVEYINALIKDGRLGQIRHFRGRFFANRLAPPEHPLEWRHLEEIAGSGVIGDLICHTLDMAHYLFCDYDDIEKIAANGDIIIPQRLDPVTGTMVKVTADETMSVFIKLKDKTEITLESSRYSPFETEFQMTGSKGSVKYNMMEYNKIQQMFYETEGQYSQKYSQQYEKIEIPLAYQKNADVEGRFIQQNLAFTEAILSGRRLKGDFSDACANQKVLDEIQFIYKNQS